MAIAEAPDNNTNPTANFRICLSLVPGISYARSGASPPHRLRPSYGLRERNLGFVQRSSRRETRHTGAPNRARWRQTDLLPDSP